MVFGLELVSWDEKVHKSRSSANHVPERYYTVK
jgi:hypothetical protein